ncbi:MAG: hypothetical protein KC496_02610 [Anaerolineae bacterium]|nr:hypothetical protein [Anaerolineae bacterium]
MQPSDETAPRRADIFPEDEYEDSGPGCLVWGLVLAFGLIIAVAIVLTALFAGFNDGVELARSTAAAATQADVAIQCQNYETDLYAGRGELAALRLDALLAIDPLPACAVPLVQLATEYIVEQDSAATATQSFAATEIAIAEQINATSTAMASQPLATPETTQEVIAQG